MNQKILWKIESLWQKYYAPLVALEAIHYPDISDNYDQRGFSKYYHRFHRVERFDFSCSKKPVFSDDNGEYVGLEKCQVLESKGKLVYLFDNHNEMIYPIVEIAEKSPQTYDIVHIDAHPDNAPFEGEKPTNISIGEVDDFIKKTRISDFFDAISEVSLRGTKQSQKIIGEIYRVTHSDDFEFFLPPEKPYILSLDIDIFGPEGDFVGLKDKVRAIALAWSGAEAVCVATSPGFIDQQYVREVIEVFMKKL